jgi:hypothetical protein
MLLHWADRVGLLRTDYDARLDAPDTKEIVFRALGCIRTLLSDASQLQIKYGVQMWSHQEPANSICGTLTAPADTRWAISGPQMERLNRALEKMRLLTQIPEQTSLKAKFRWAIRDKQQFEKLLQDLSYFTTRLDDLLPAAHPTPRITQSDL